MTIATSSRTDVVYFGVAILGLSFWFLTAVPFASHRETYSWLAGSTTGTLAEQVQFGNSSTYRPFSMVVIFWLFQWLDPDVFPTNTLRQAVLQGLVYAAFIIAWWVMFRAASCRRAFALTALIAGAVLFSGYVHLFHIYGLMYVPVVWSLAAVIYLQASNSLERFATWLAAATTVLVLWHPFAAAVFVACYVGHSAEVFQARTWAWRARTVLVLAIPAAATFTSVVVFARDSNALDSRLVAFLASYRTNELNLLVSATVLALSCMAAASMMRPPRLALGAALTSAAGLAFISAGVPVLFLWFGIVLVKLARARTWSLFCLMLAMTLLPLGGATGTPIHTLFAIVVAVYGTALRFDDAEWALAVVKPQYAFGAIAVAAVVVVLMRTGREVPILSRAASPLLAERERTFQLELVLAWMRDSPYCGSAIAFIDPAGSPVDSIESAINRQHRPPAAIEDVRFFWNTVLRCEPRDDMRTAIVAFGGPAVAGSVKVYELPGTYAHPASVWILRAQAQGVPR